MFVLLFFTCSIILGQEDVSVTTIEISKDEVSGKFGAKTNAGDTVIAFDYDKLRGANDNRFLASQNERWFILDGTGSRLSNKDYKYLSKSKDGYLLLYTDDLVGLITINEKVVIEPTYEFLFLYDEGFLSATLNGKKGLINLQEEVIVPFEYNGLLLYLDVVFLRKDQKWAIADKQGKLQSDFIYKWVNYKEGDDFITLSMEGERVKLDGQGNVVD